MAEHLSFGKKSEDKAVEWLEQHGYEILHRNWKFSYFEIDIIAKKNEVLHIIEVKARHYGPIGFPENYVGRKKFKRLQRAADQFLFMNPGISIWLQYDILVITDLISGITYFFHHEDVYCYVI